MSKRSNFAFTATVTDKLNGRPVATATGTVQATDKTVASQVVRDEYASIRHDVSVTVTPK